jgi:16S rRNA (guanine1516-N2)-methyltransferase
MPSLKAAVTYVTPEFKDEAVRIAAKFGLDFIEPADKHLFPALLTLSHENLSLSLSHHKSGSISVDFLSAATLYRYHHGGGRQQLLARAIGLHKQKDLKICDISAGLGNDAFVLASLGAQVIMVERSPIIAALLEDGWSRAQRVEWVHQLSWQFIFADSQRYLQSLPIDQRSQVIYFDPMFPERKKSALVKKSMRLLREVVGEDLDAPELLTLALKTALNRVVVKRPRLAPAIPGPTPSFTLTGQSSRFDIYLVR